MMVLCRLLAAVVAIVTAAVVAPCAAGYPWPVCGGTTNSFAPNSTFQANLKRIAATLPKNTSGLYSTAVVGTVPDQIWAMALCRGDVNATECSGCLTRAFRDVQSLCSRFKDASIYYDPCMLHYSDVHIISDDDTGPTTGDYPIVNAGNVTSSDPARFNRVLAALVDATADHAAFNSTRRFATGEAADLNPKVYTVAQCPPDQSPAQCRKCLAGIIRDSWELFQSHTGGRVLGVNCTYRFETAPFYRGPAMVRLLATPSPSPAGAPLFYRTAATNGRGRNHRKVFIIALLASVTLFCCVMLVGCILRLRKGSSSKRRRSARTQADALKQWRIEEDDIALTLYDFSELADATDVFSIENQLGRGGFGPVYKGKLRNGVEIAVKRLEAQSVQGLVEFKNEIQLIAKLQHQNLVRLLGCCVEEEEKLLVYDYMPNGSLDFFIFDPVRRRLLDWKKRLHIIEGIVQGLLYLHKLSRVRIIHRDLKASNILLDKDLNPKISDFGMARIVRYNDMEANTTRVVGTYGYMAPEYASEGIFSVRSDVFSFGVLLLEIISGKRNCSYHHYGDFVNLLGYAWQLGKEERAVELIDLELVDSVDTACIVRCVKVALLCVQENAMDRPTMTEVALMLDSDWAVLKDPQQPPHFHLRFNDDNSGGEDVLGFLEVGT